MCLTVKGAADESLCPHLGILPNMRRRTRRVVLGVVVLIAVAGVLLFVVFPSGAGSVEEAAVDRVSERADKDSARALARFEWGGGELVLIGYERDGERRLGIAYIQDALRGWRVRAFTEEAVESNDIVVGSLVVAKSAGGGGAPSWSVAAGQLEDPRIQRIEVKWASGGTSSAERAENSYLVTQEGETDALEVKFIADDGSEIATVPVENT